MDYILTFVVWLVAFLILVAVLMIVAKPINNYFKKKGSTGSGIHKFIMYILIIIFAVCAWLLRH
jgi:hypothetical protein